MRQAGLGEAGEIYVRSYHLAKGYLGLEQATAEKFLPNPFGQGAGEGRVGARARLLPGHTHGIHLCVLTRMASSASIPPGATNNCLKSFFQGRKEV